MLSLIVDLRCISSLSFMPLGPYPACYARHLPHEGKALSVAILFPHMRVFALTLWGEAVFSYRSLPHWGRGTASAVDRVLSLIVDLRCISSLSFMLLEPYPAGDTRENCHPQTFGHRPHIYLRRSRHHNPEPDNPFHFTPCER